MILQAGRFQLDLSQPKIMGVLNVTPDSFSDGGRFVKINDALKQVEVMVNAGVDIIDIGGESSRPGAKLVSEAEELERIIPVIKEIQRNFNICLSVDTNKPSVMRQVLDLGVDFINDIKGFSEDRAFSAVAPYTAAICIMHMQGLPENMQNNPQYNDCVTEVSSFLYQQAVTANKHGIIQSRICIDPGFGFGKSAAQNMQLLREIRQYNDIYPVLFGLSRKTTLGTILGDKEASRLQASVAGALLAIANGASIVRVHDVKETADALKVYQAMVNSEFFNRG